MASISPNRCPPLPNSRAMVMTVWGIGVEAVSVGAVCMALSVIQASMKRYHGLTKWTMGPTSKAAITVPSRTPYNPPMKQRDRATAIATNDQSKPNFI